MANLPGRSALPYLPQLMTEAGAPQVTAAALKALRNQANLSRPADGTLQKVVYRSGLVKREIASVVVDILNFHLQRRNLRTVHADAIIDFDFYIEGFGRCLNVLESTTVDPEQDPIGNIAAVAGFTTDVVLALKRRRLFPQVVVQAIANAVQTTYGYPGLRVVQAPLIEHALQPPPAAMGRTEVINWFASRGI